AGPTSSLDVLALHAEEGLARRRAHAELRRVDDGVDDLRVLAVEVEADAAKVALRQPLPDPVPRLAAVGCSVQPTTRSPLPGGVVAVVTVLQRHIAWVAIELVALPLPRGDEQRLRIGRTHLNVDDASPLIDGQDLVPGLAAVRRLVEPTFAAWPVESSERADVDDVGVGGMNGDTTDLKTLLESHVLPGLAAVRGLVDAIAIRHRVARVVLSCSHPDDFRVGLGHGNVANRDSVFPVELMLEGHAVVGRLEQPARRRRDPVPRC